MSTYHYAVVATVMAPNNDPVDIPWYRGTDHVKALSALVSCAADVHAGEASNVPESARFRTLAVTMSVVLIHTD